MELHKNVFAGARSGTGFRKMPLFIFILLMVCTIIGTVGPTLAKSTGSNKKNTDPALKAVFETIAAKEAERDAVRFADIEKNLSELEKKWGIQMMGLRTSAAGYMLDWRFRVLDPEKAFPLLRRNIDRYLVVEKSGAVLRVPFTAKLGSMRATVRTANMIKRYKIYAGLFANPGQHVKPGDKVSLVVGNFIADDMLVQ